MTAHVHAWEPAAGVMARYTCACGTWGRRMRGGAIAAMKAPPMFAPGLTLTARPSVLGAAVVDGTGANEPKITAGASRTAAAPRAP